MNRRVDFYKMSLLVILLVAVPTAGILADDGIPIEVKDEIERLLGKKASELYESKNEDGLRTKRGTWSRNYHKAGDNEYTVVFTTDTADAGRLRTDRSLLTLTRDAAGAWSVTGEEVIDSYSRMIRDIPGDEQYRSFDRFELEREGMKVTGSGGDLVLDYLDGSVHRIVVAAPDLSYSYSPPSDLPYNQAYMYKHLQERNEPDFLFDPELIVIKCSTGVCQEILDTAFSGLAESSLGSLDKDLQQYHQQWIEKEEESRSNSVFSGFTLPLEPDREYYSISVKKRSKDHWLGLQYDSYEAWEVMFTASGYGVLYGYISEESRNAGVKPYDVEKTDDLFAKDFELEALKGEVSVAIEDSELLQADITFVLNLKRDCREIPFRLNSFRGFGDNTLVEKQPSLTINSIVTGDGQDLGWILTGSSYGFIVFPDTVKAGTKLTLHMSFENRGSIIKYTPSFSFMDRGGWLPFVRFTDRIDDFELTIRTPSKYQTLGIGTKISEETTGKVTTTRWKAMSPVAFPTFIFGDYRSEEPRIKATRIDGSEIPVRIYGDVYGMADKGIRPKQMRTLAEQAVNSLNLYREIYGVDYPYGKLDLVTDPVGMLGPLYGQAPSSLIFVGWLAFRGEGLLGSVTGEGALTRVTKDLVAHEVGHQWWGHTVSNSNMRNYWFIESFTEYATALFVEALHSDGGKSPDKGWEAYLTKVSDWRKTVMDVDLISSVQDASALYSGENGIGSYIAAVYNKGPYALHILRMTFGMEKMDLFLKTLLQEFRNKEITARDIQTVAERIFEVDMDWFFDQWIRGVGVPEYSFYHRHRKTEDGNWLVQGYIKQHVVVGNRKEELPGVHFKGVVPITVLGSDHKEYTVRVVVEGEDTPFGFKVPVEPLEVTLNKYGEILAHDIHDNQQW